MVNRIVKVLNINDIQQNEWQTMFSLMGSGENYPPVCGIVKYKSVEMYVTTWKTTVSNGVDNMYHIQ